MKDYDPREELAPRDIVARAIHSQRAQGDGAFLDARTAIGDEFPEAFPTVFAACVLIEMSLVGPSSAFGL